jgi:hypothetical protein
VSPYPDDGGCGEAPYLQGQALSIDYEPDVQFYENHEGENRENPEI